MVFGSLWRRASVPSHERQQQVVCVGWVGLPVHVCLQTLRTEVKGFDRGFSKAIPVKNVLGGTAHKQKLMLIRFTEATIAVGAHVWQMANLLPSVESELETIVRLDECCYQRLVFEMSLIYSPIQIPETLDALWIQNSIRDETELSLHIVSKFILDILCRVQKFVICLR